MPCVHYADAENACVCELFVSQLGHLAGVTDDAGWISACKLFVYEREKLRKGNC